MVANIEKLVDVIQDMGEGAYQQIVDWSTRVAYNTEITKLLVVFLCFFVVFSMIFLFFYLFFRFKKLERMINRLEKNKGVT